MAERYKEVSDQAFIDIQDLVFNNEGWEELDKSKLPDTIYYSAIKEVGNTGVKVVKAWGFVDCEADKIINDIWIEDEAKKKKLDVNTVAHKIVEDIDSDSMQVIYQRYKLPWPLSHRDFCFLRWIERLDDGTIFFVSKSVKHEDCPVVKKVVRGNIINSAYVAQPTDEGTKFCYCVQLDPCGKIPTWLVNTNLYKVSLRVKQLQFIYENED
eukprot:TRINITY_DN1749_c0_g1_i1.p1 TRINITY_DN1749_c0_g1~~TRINITY_DN1749_c0_g1_i1.p1  ORF type:complete len:211 (-),score=69.42 TRINITY_DN1749_c0_g1_i1:113-745(-)